MLNPRSFTLPMAGLALCVSLAAATTPTFEADVQPIFAAKCVMCHGAAPQGKLDLRTQQSVLNGGASGPVVLPGESAKSLLLNKVVTRQMPPGNAKLTDAEIDRIRIWIDKGLAPRKSPVTVSRARGPRHLSGSLRPLSRLHRPQGRTRHAHRSPAA